MVKNQFVKISLMTLTALMLITSVTTVASAQLVTPCAIYGSVYYNGELVSGASVVASAGNVITGGSDYKVDNAPPGSAVDITATYNGHSQTITVNTPTLGGPVNGQNIYIRFAPVAGISATPASGTAPLDVTFADASTGGVPTSWSWSFGDSATSTAQNPGVHTYSTAGTYTVTLTVSNGGGSSSATRTVTVASPTPVPTPVADFTGTPLSGTAPLTVQFNDISVNIGSKEAWSWDFGDGATLSGNYPAPAHTYTTAGTFTVKLTIAASGDWLVTKNGYVTVGSPTATPTATPTPVPSDSSVFVFGTDGASATSGDVTVSVIRTGSTSDTSSVQVWIGASTAVLGTDYSLQPAAPLTLTFGPGETAKSFTVKIVGDFTDKAAKTVALLLSSPSSGDAIGHPSTYTLTLGGQPAVVTATPTNAPSVTVTPTPTPVPATPTPVPVATENTSANWLWLLLLLLIPLAGLVVYYYGFRKK